MNCRIPVEVMRRLTSGHERNIYIHPNPLAREIFWQRIDALVRMIVKECTPRQRGLDFGGGSGALVRFWSEWGGEVDLLDLDAADARQLAEHYPAPTLHIIEADVADHQPDHPYDFIVAADVLEHFPDLSVPLGHMQRLLRPGGCLLVSVPTENWLYELGRAVVGKRKPADHYHSSRQIITALEAAGLTVQASQYVPEFCGLRLPLFAIGIFRKSLSVHEEK